MFTVIGQLLMNNDPADMVTVEHTLKQKNWLADLPIWQKLHRKPQV